MELKKMLINYDLKHYNVAEPSEAEVSGNTCDVVVLNAESLKNYFKGIYLSF